MMAHAIDIAGADRRPTDRARSPRTIGPRPCGCRATRAGYSAARRRLQLRHDRDDDHLQFADDRVEECTVREGRRAGTGGPTSRLETDRPDARPGSAHHDVDTTAAAARRHALVHTVARPPAGRPAHGGRAGVATCRPAAPSTRAVYALDRSRVRDESRRRDRLVSRSAAARRGVLRRREDGDSSSRPAGTGPAAVARTRRTAWPPGPPTRDTRARCGRQPAGGRGAAPTGGPAH